MIQGCHASGTVTLKMPPVFFEARGVRTGTKKYI